MSKEPKPPMTWAAKRALRKNQMVLKIFKDFVRWQQAERRSAVTERRRKAMESMRLTKNDAASKTRFGVNNG
jgi:hypothetical protein